MKKRGAVYGVITLMLCMAVYLNWSYTKDTTNVISNNDLQLESSKNYGESKFVDDTNNSDKNSDNKNDKNSEEKSKETSDYFAEARYTRTRARDEAIGILETSKNTEGVADTEKISQTLTQIAENSIKESRVETMIKAKGFQDSVVFIGDEDVSVIAKKADSELDAIDVAKIKDIVISEANVLAKNIKITQAP